MRPIHRGSSPRNEDYADYKLARPELVSRLGEYCSYCERPTDLDVEHIQPQKLYDGLKGRWENFLLACRNCNATKKHKDVVFDSVLLPDRDNTFAAFEYLPNGGIRVLDSLDPSHLARAAAILALVGLDKRIACAKDSNDRSIALDRASRRIEAWALAARALDRLSTRPDVEEMRDQIVELALKTGFFSIWMKVFEGETDMRCRFIRAFPGTALECFHSDTTAPIWPRPRS